MPAPTLSKPAGSGTAPQANGQAPSNQPAPALIPFTRAARKKSRLIGQIGPINLTAAQQQVAPVQVPANGYLRKIILDISGITAGNAANVAFANDAPWSILQGVSLAAANGDSLINPLDGFALTMVTKYGCFSGEVKDPCADPVFFRTTGAGGAGGSFHFQLEIPVEIDARDALGALPNMAANQSFLLQMFLNTIANIYTTAPTNPPAVTITMTAEYWAAPAAQNQAGVAQQTAPRVANAVSLIQTQQPNISPGVDQQIQLLNVGNTIRWIMFILRTAAGARTQVDWPAQGNILVNNDYWYYKTIDNWLRQMSIDYNLRAGVAATPTLNSLDTGVFVLTDFMNDGGQGSELASSSANRDLMLVTGSATALYFEANVWGAAAGSLQVITNSVRVPDPTSFYAPLGI